MKKIILTALMSLVSFSTLAAKMTPMGVVEKSAYQISGLVNKKLIDPSFLTDTMTVSIKVTDQGFETTLKSPSAETNVFNTLTLSFDAKGKAVGYSSQFVSAFQNGPVFKKANASELLDLGAEAIVDHLNDSADIQMVAANAKTVQMQPIDGTVVLKITLINGQIYTIKMDSAGKVLEKGF